MNFQDTQLIGVLARAESTVNSLSGLLSGLVEKFSARGHALYLVGGSVRDALLGRLGNDLDFTTPARPEVVKEILDEWAETVWDTGIAYGTVSAVYKGQQIEITTFRSDSYDGQSRNPEVIYGDSLEGDLVRRDFKVNAMAIELLADATFATNAHIVMMGGALTVPGNVSAWAEANISQDPDATDYLFLHSQDVTMVGLDVTLRTLLTEKETARWRATGTAAGEIFADMVDYYIRAYATTAPHLGGCGLHDPLAVAVAADPSLVEVVETNMKTDTEGPTRGRTIADETRLSQEPTAKVAVGVDNERFVSEFVDRLEELFRTVGAK